MAKRSKQNKHSKKNYVNQYKRQLLRKGHPKEVTIPDPNIYSDDYEENIRNFERKYAPEKTICGRHFEG